MGFPRLQKPTESKVLVVQAISSGFDGKNDAKIMINDLPLILGKNENGNFRGLHIVTINPDDGKVAEAKVFDTYKSSYTFDEFTTHEVPEGYIVVAACMDDCTK